MPYIVISVVDKKNKLIDWLYIVDYFLSRILHLLRDTSIAFEGLHFLRRLLDDYNLWAERDHHHTITYDTGPRFTGLVGGAAPFSRLLRLARGTEDLFLPGFPREIKKESSQVANVIDNCQCHW